MIPLFKPYMPPDLPETDNILHSGNLAYGKWGKVFEEKVGDYIGNKQVAVVNSYNSAMLIALSVIGFKPGDEVIASPMSCLASNQPFATLGLKVVWADIDPNRGTLDPDSVKSKITTRTKAIFHNHYCGYPGYIDEINSIGASNNIIIVDDAIEAFGSEYKGNRLGNTGSDLTVFSFQTVRLPNTIDGGALAFKDSLLYKKALLVRDYGIDRKGFRDELGEINPLCDINLNGFGATLSDFNSYIGYLQMKDIASLLTIQRKNAQEWKSKISNSFPEIDPIEDYLISPNYWVYGTLTNQKMKFLKKFRNHGFYASGVHVPNTNYSVFGERQQLMGVEEFSSRFLALPCGWWL